VQRWPLGRRRPITLLLPASAAGEAFDPTGREQCEEQNRVAWLRKVKVSSRSGWAGSEALERYRTPAGGIEMRGSQRLDNALGSESHHRREVRGKILPGQEAANRAAHPT